ncbi:MAG: B12-binding domain-containing radical SAM protein, partial [Rhodoferax sp.]|nr:B12-binding domain-containing radical SAM protein [Rhodoferax sp.]
VDALYDHLCQRGDVPQATVHSALLADYLASGARGGHPRALQGSLSRRARLAHAQAPAADSLVQRQQRHLAD